MRKLIESMSQSRYPRELPMLSGAACALLLAVLMGAGCNGVDVVSTDGSMIVADSVNYGGNARTAVCDPFSNNPTYAAAGIDHGIVAQLRYLDDSQPRYSNVNDYVLNAHSADATLFFSDINVPTRKFDLGFTTLGGQTLMNQNGTTLYEYFSVSFQTEVQLTDSQAEGPYQFALLADDGAVMQADIGSGFQTIVDDNGTHPTKFKVSTSPVTLVHGQRLPVHIDYYQGPRYHISVVLMWRPWPQAGGADPANGTSGNSLFFDFNTIPSTPQAAYQALLSRGWNVIPPSNFKLPQAVATNPCVVNSPPPVPVGVSAFCAADAFVPKSVIKVGLAADPAEGSAPGILAGLSAMGYPATLYTDADVVAGRPTTDGVTVLVVSRVAAVQSVSAGFAPAIQAFIQGGGSVIGEYDGAALFFDAAGSGDPGVLGLLTPPLALFSGSVDGGGLLVPVSTSLLTVTDATDAIMVGVPMTYLQGNKAAFGVNGVNPDWLHVSATFNSVGALNWGPQATYPAVMSGRCNKGRVALFTMSLLNSASDAPVMGMTSNAIRWVSGN